MKVNVNIKRTFKMNGREYKSLDEMPPDVRVLFEKNAAQKLDGNESSSTRTNARISINGTEYENIEEMPTFARNLYEQAVKAATDGAKGPAAGEKAERATGPRPTAPESSFSARSVFVGVLIAALAYALYIVLLKG